MHYNALYSWTMVYKKIQSLLPTNLNQYHVGTKRQHKSTNVSICFPSGNIMMYGFANGPIFKTKHTLKGAKFIDHYFNIWKNYVLTSIYWSTKGFGGFIFKRFYVTFAKYEGFSSEYKIIFTDGIVFIDNTLYELWRFKKQHVITCFVSLAWRV